MNTPDAPLPTPPPQIDPPPPTRTRIVIVLIALVAGIALWRQFDTRNLWTALSAVLQAVAVAVAGLMVASESLRRASGNRLRLITAAVFVGSLLYIWVNAIVLDRPMYPLGHDECTFTIQAQQFARGRLWYPQHPLADFFEAVNLFTKPVYAAPYFPGTALLQVPGVWLGLPYSVIPMLIAAGMVTLLFRVVCELLDPGLGLLAALTLTSLGVFHNSSIHVMAHLAMPMLGLAVWFTWLQWRKQQRIGWAVLMGLCAGLAAVTRPLDALAYCIPVAAAVLWELRGRPTRHVVSTIASAIVPIVPFIALQLAMDVGITGSALRTPVTMYMHDVFGVKTQFALPGGKGKSAPPVDMQCSANSIQMRLYHRDWIVPLHQRQEQETVMEGLFWRLRLIFIQDLPSLALVPLLLAALIALRTCERRVILLQLPLYVAAYLTFAYYFPSYALNVAPVVIVMLMLGIDAVTSCFAGARQNAARLVLCWILVLLAVLPLVIAFSNPVKPRLSLAQVAHEAIRDHVAAPAIVLFRYDPSKPQAFLVEPVFNTDVAWLDDAPVIRAHDLGAERNTELFDYYAKRSPDRRVYLLDRKDDSLYDLGMLSDIVRQPATMTSTTPSAN